MTDNEITLLAKRYIDSALNGQSAPSDDAYDAAVSKVEAETRKLVAARRRDDDRVAIVC